MSEVLVPYIEYEGPELAEQLNALVIDNSRQLKQRGFQGLVGRYGSDLHQAEVNVRKGQYEHPEVGHYAVVDWQKKVIGAASIQPRLSLRKQHLPMPANISRTTNFLASKVEKLGPNVSAWTEEREFLYLADAYRELKNIAGANRNIETANIWTIEPSHGIDTVTQSIRRAGFIEMAKGRFDDQEYRWRVPARAVLYFASGDKKTS